MRKTTGRMLSLHSLILMLALCVIGLTLVNSMVASYQVNKKTLIANTLETNRVYAQKLAATTDLFMRQTLKELTVSAEEIASHMDDASRLSQEVSRLKRESETFDSIMITDAFGRIRAMVPHTPELIGQVMREQEGPEALVHKQASISKPYRGFMNRLIVFISAPIYKEDGTYAGLIGGTIPLQEPNVLNQLLGQHFYRDGSYVYIVDQDGRIVYHQHPDRINDSAASNPVVQDLMKEQSGARRVINTKGQDMLAGYAFIPITKWGVVSQRPTEQALLPSMEILKDMFIVGLPFFLLLIILTWQMARRIAQPMWQLSTYVEHATKNRGQGNVEAITAWYYEAVQLKRAVVQSFDHFHQRIDHFMYESATDALTGLANRRTADDYCKSRLENGEPFALILLDIDCFKRINDTYGHQVGDDVLRFLAEQMRNSVRPSDVCCRYGGEEFIMLLPDTDARGAYEAAERLRRTMESSMSPCGEVVTISAGIAVYPQHASDMMQILKEADRCLYEAKRSGRNQTVLCER